MSSGPPRSKRPPLVVAGRSGSSPPPWCPGATGSGSSIRIPTGARRRPVPGDRTGPGAVGRGRSTPDRPRDRDRQERLEPPRCPDRRGVRERHKGRSAQLPRGSHATFGMYVHDVALHSFDAARPTAPSKGFRSKVGDWIDRGTVKRLESRALRRSRFILVSSSHNQKLLGDYYHIGSAQSHADPDRHPRPGRGRQPGGRPARAPHPPGRPGRRVRGPEPRPSGPAPRPGRLSKGPGLLSGRALPHRRVEHADPSPA